MPPPRPPRHVAPWTPRTRGGPHPPSAEGSNERTPPQRASADAGDATGRWWTRALGHLTALQAGHTASKQPASAPDTASGETPAPAPTATRSPATAQEPPQDPRNTPRADGVARPVRIRIGRRDSWHARTILLHAPSAESPPRPQSRTTAPTLAGEGSDDTPQTHALPKQGGTQDLPGAGPPTRPKTGTWLKEHISSMQSQLLQLQEQVKALHATLEQSALTPTANPPEPRTTANPPERPTTASRPQQAMEVQHHRPPVLDSPRRQAFQAAWQNYCLHKRSLMEIARGHYLLYPRSLEGKKRQKGLLDPTERALATVWRRYQLCGREVAVAVVSLTQLLSTAPLARPSPDLRHRTGATHGSSEDAGRKNDREQDEADRMVNTRPPSQTENLNNKNHKIDREQEEADRMVNTRLPSQTENLNNKNHKIDREQDEADHMVNTRLPSQTENLNNKNHKNDRLRSTTPRQVKKPQSLFEELFPEATSPPPSSAPAEKKRDPYPKLELPDPPHVANGQLSKVERPQTKKAKLVEAFQKNMENITVLQLSHCSIELMEADFLRLIPKGKHIEGWRRGGEFFKIIPGRDPLSLERMPFYYLLFNSPEAALAYQNNVARLHKLNALHQSTNILSAVPAPKGFLEDGEDISKATLSYNLAPTQHELNLATLMQPYNPALRALIERGGYNPIVPDVDEQGQRIWKVLMYIEGYEPAPSDLFKTFSTDAWRHGMQLSLRTESMASIHRLRDTINLKTSAKPISSIGPRAYGSFDRTISRRDTTFDDPVIQSLMADVEEEGESKEMNQYVMNRVYNRWMIDFDNENAARRFAIHWHRRVLPAVTVSNGVWEEADDERMCNTEVLW